MSGSTVPWRKYSPPSLFDKMTKGPTDQLLRDHDQLVDAILSQRNQVENRLREAKGRLVAAGEPEHQKWLSEILADLGLESEEVATRFDRLQWAFFLAGHSAYEAELVELAFGDASANKYAADAVKKLKEALRILVSDFDDLLNEAKRLKSFRDELAHGGGELRLYSPHEDAVRHYQNRCYLDVRESDSAIEFADRGFAALANAMSQIVVVSRAARAAQA